MLVYLTKYLHSFGIMFIFWFWFKSAFSILDTKGLLEIEARVSLPPPHFFFSDVFPVSAFSNCPSWTVPLLLSSADYFCCLIRSSAVSTCYVYMHATFTISCPKENHITPVVCGWVLGCAEFKLWLVCIGSFKGDIVKEILNP